MTSTLQNNLCRGLRSACAVAIGLTAGVVAPAQPSSSTITGEVRIEGAPYIDELTIDVESAIGGRSGIRTQVRPDGGFEIRDVPFGTYFVSLENRGGEVIWREVIPVSASVTPLIINVHREAREQIHGGTVSVARLRQKPSPAALHEMQLAEKASDRHKMAEAIEHLQRAVGLAPDMADAHNNLGVKYLLSGKYEAARCELETAVKLDPEASAPHTNLALALLALGLPNEAEMEARLALRRDPLSPGANFAAGAALNQTGKPDEALRYLDQAGDRVAQALLMEAKLLLARSQSAEAIAKIRDYLARPGVPQRAEVTEWLNNLQARANRR